MVASEKKYPELAIFSDEIERCGRCGFCQDVCPVYDVSADERGVARGRNMYAKALISGALDHTPENEAFFTECLLCRACVEMCFSAVKTDEIVLAGRRSNRRMHGMSATHKYVFERLLPDIRRFENVIRMVRAARGAVPPWLGQPLGVFGWLGASIARADEFAGDIPGEFLRTRLLRRKKSTKATKWAVLFIGCGTNLMFPQVGDASVEVLEELGYEMLIVEHGCCGLPAFAHGELMAVEHLARNNMRAFLNEPDSIIVTDCSSCASFLKDYPKILSIGNRIGQTEISEAESFSSRVRDITEILAAEELGQLFKHKRVDMTSPSQTVSFHDSCHLSRYQKLGHQARQVICSLPGVDFVEMKEANWCCGGAGAFALEHPSLSIEILGRKVQNVISSGAKTILTTCPSCMMQIRSGIKKAGPDIRIAHLVEVVCECMLDNRRAI